MHEKTPRSCGYWLPNVGTQIENRSVYEGKAKRKRERGFAKANVADALAQPDFRGCVPEGFSVPTGNWIFRNLEPKLDDEGWINLAGSIRLFGVKELLQFDSEEN